MQNEPVYGLHPIGIITDTAMRHIFLRQRLVVSDDDPTKDKTVDEGKLVKRENVGGPGKTCWFKEADELTEDPDICFCNGVSPDCRDYTLQALIHHMDNKIEMERKMKAEKVQGGHIEQTLSAKDMKQHETKTIFLIDEIKSKEHSVGRTVFVVTVGQMKHFQIFLKPVRLIPMPKISEFF